LKTQELITLSTWAALYLLELIDGKHLKQEITFDRSTVLLNEEIEEMIHTLYVNIMLESNIKYVYSLPALKFQCLGVYLVLYDKRLLLFS
jgi:hypothetical protein